MVKRGILAQAAGCLRPTDPEGPSGHGKASQDTAAQVAELGVPSGPPSGGLQPPNNWKTSFSG